MSDLSALSDEALRDQYLRSLSNEDLQKLHQQAAQPVAPSYGRSIGTSALENAAAPGDMSQAANTSRQQAAQGTAMAPIMKAAAALDPANYLPTSGALKNAASYLTGFKPVDQAEKNLEGMGQKAVSAGVGALANPFNVVGGGSIIPLRVAGALAGGAGSEVGGELGGTPGAIAGGLAGGLAASKLPGMGTAAQDLSYRAIKNAATGNYANAEAAGLKLNPGSVAAGYAGPTMSALRGSKRTATYEDLRDLVEDAAKYRNNPNLYMDAGDLKDLRETLGRRSRNTAPENAEEARAAGIALRGLNDYLENVPQSGVMAGNLDQYVRETRLGNANYAQAQKLRQFEKKVTSAEDTAEGSIATRLDNQLKSKTRQILGKLDSPEVKDAQGGYSADEINALRQINRGSIPENFARQAARPMGTLGLHGIGLPLTGAAAYSGHPEALGLQLGMAALGSGLKKFAENRVLNNVQNYRNLVAGNTPYARGLPPALQQYPGLSQMGRGAILGFGQ